MNIAILGGSFDPPHNGHLFVAKQMLKNKNCDKVILMPVFKHPFGKLLTDPEHRLAMTRLLEDKNIEVSDFEIKRKKISYSIDTLNALKKLAPHDDFVWVIGKDQIGDFEKWKNWREIKEEFGLIVVPRTPIDVSSSEIRKRINPPDGGRKSISGMVPEKIESYIIHHKLYL